MSASNSESRKVGKYTTSKTLQQALGAENVDRLLATWLMICDIEHIILEVSIRLPLGGNILHHAVSSDHRLLPTWHGKLGRAFQMSELLMRSGSNSFALSNISLTMVTLPGSACQVLRITDDIDLNLSCTG